MLIETPKFTETNVEDFDLHVTKMSMNNFIINNIQIKTESCVSSTAQDTDLMVVQNHLS